MKVIYNKTTGLYWNNENGWCDDTEADYFEDHENAQLPFVPGEEIDWVYLTWEHCMECRAQLAELIKQWEDGELFVNDCKRTLNGSNPRSSHK